MDSCTMDEKRNLIAGSRKSQLAVVQTEAVIGLLQKSHPSVSCCIETMETLGDKILDKALPKIGGKSVFTRDLEVALAERKVDFIVHSLKDLPTTLPENMTIAAVLERESPYDAVIFHQKHQDKLLQELPEGSVIGTSSLRRIAQLRRNYPQLQFKNVRGNLNTRLRKLDESGDYDALILAAAGVNRLNWQSRIGQVLKDDFLYAVGQGALAVEARLNDYEIISLLSRLTDPKTLLCCAAERSFLRILEGGCSVPVGVYSSFSASKLTLVGAVLSLDGKKCVRDSVDCIIEFTTQKSESPVIPTKNGLVVQEHYTRAVEMAEELGVKLATSLKSGGASEILAQVRSTVESHVDIHKPLTEG